MRILILAEFYSNYSGNFIPTILAFKNEAHKRGHETIFAFSNKNPSEAFQEWIKPFSISNQTTLFDFESKNFVNDVSNLIHKEKVDIVYYHFGSSLKLSQIKKRTPKHVLFFQHIHNSMYLKKNLHSFLKRIRNYLFLDHDIHKICCSQSIARSAKYIFPGSKISIQHNAIDFSRLRRKSSNVCEKFNILLLGHNYYIKGVDVAIEAILQLSNELDVHLDIIMGDKLEDNKKIIIEKYGLLPTCISILEPTNKIVDLYQNHQVFLNASREEGMSYANLEAYYCGALFVSSDIAQNKEPQLPNAIYFRCGSVEDLKRAILHAFSLKNSYSNNCDYVEKNFSLEVWASNICNIMGI